jgi:hypothetical protein
LIVPVTGKPQKTWAEFFRDGPFVDPDFPDDIRDSPPRDVETF